MAAAGGSQPGAVRAGQKDAQYLGELRARLEGLLEGAVGPRRALALRPEAGLASSLLYYGASLGRGVPSPGEEHCELTPGEGARGAALRPGRRVLLVVFRAVLPYLQERGAQRGGGLLQPGGSEAGDWARLVRSGGGVDVSGANGAGPGPGSGSGTTVAALEPSRGRLGLARGAAARVAALALRAAHKWRSFWGAAGPYLDVAEKTHLALFYCFGTYYFVANRLTGVRLVYTGQQSEIKLHYQVVGLLMFLQLGLSGASWAAAHAAPSTSNASARGTATRAGGVPPGIPLVDSKGREVTDGAGAAEGATTSGGGGVPGKCPLCLSAMVSPTATPCGHLFCWNCVAEWSLQKPECPICRAPATPAALVCIHDNDFWDS